MLQRVKRQPWLLGLIIPALTLVVLLVTDSFNLRGSLFGSYSSASSEISPVVALSEVPAQAPQPAAPLGVVRSNPRPRPGPAPSPAERPRPSPPRLGPKPAATEAVGGRLRMQARGFPKIRGCQQGDPQHRHQGVQAENGSCIPAWAEAGVRQATERHSASRRSPGRVQAAA